jgi:hypothetical protein
MSKMQAIILTDPAAFSQRRSVSSGPVAHICAVKGVPSCTLR